MKKCIALLIMTCAALCHGTSLELEKLNEWKLDPAPGYYESTRGIKSTHNICALINNQLFYIETWMRDITIVETLFSIKNYRTGKVTYQFQDQMNLWGNIRAGYIRDQNGRYLFFEKNNTPFLFDVESRLEIPVPINDMVGLPETIYYIQWEEASGKSYYRLVKHNLRTNEIREIDLNNKISSVILINYYQTLEDIGNNQLRMYNNYSNKSLQLNEDMTKILDITEINIGDFLKEDNLRLITYFRLLGRNQYIGILETPEWTDDAGSEYFIALIDKSNNIIKEYPNNRLLQNESLGGTYLESLCILSPDKRTLLLFENIAGESTRTEVYRIIYGDEAGKECIAVRPLSIQSARNINSPIFLEIKTTERMKILDRSGETAIKGGIESNWYQVQVGNTTGWVLGKDIDILDIAYNNRPGTVNDNHVRLREKPNLQGRQIAMLSLGTKLIVEEETLELMKIGETEAVWYRVSLQNGQNGWIYGAYVDLR